MDDFRRRMPFPFVFISYLANRYQRAQGHTIAIPRSEAVSSMPEAALLVRRWGVVDFCNQASDTAVRFLKIPGPEMPIFGCENLDEGRVGVAVPTAPLVSNGRIV